MSAMTDTEYSASATSRNELAAQLQAHFDALVKEVNDMPKSAAQPLKTTLHTYVHPFVSEAAATEEYTERHGAAVAYLRMCRTHVIPKLPDERQEEMRRAWDELESRIRAYELSEQIGTHTLVRSVRDLVECVDRSQEALIGKLEGIRCELSTINTTLQPVSSMAEGSGMLGQNLSHIDYILTGSMASLVGPLPPQELPEITSIPRREPAARRRPSRI